MLVKVMSVFFDPGSGPSSGRFDDAEVQDFLKDKEVIGISDHFFVRGDVPHLFLVIKYSRHGKDKGLDSKPTAPGRRDESWRELLSDAEIGTFNLLREWRAKRSQMEAVPPYILFTNRQLAELIKVKPKTLSDLEKVEGVGKAKVEKYGQDVLEITTAPASMELGAS